MSYDEDNKLPSKNFIILAHRSNPKYLYGLLTLSSFMSLLLGWFNSAGYMNSAFWWIPRKTSGKRRKQFWGKC